MRRRGFRGVRLSIERLAPRVFHQLRNVQSPGLEAFLGQQPLQHPAARKRELHVQFADPMDQLQIGVRHRAEFVLDAAPADPQDDGLAADAQLHSRIDVFLPFRNRAALPSAPDKEPFSSVASAILACRVFTAVQSSGATLVNGWQDVRSEEAFAERRKNASSLSYIHAPHHMLFCSSWASSLE